LLLFLPKVPIVPIFSPLIFIIYVKFDMKKKLTISVDEGLLKKARKIAADKNTTVTGLIRAYLHHLQEQEEQSKEEIVTELAELLEHSEAVIGGKNWTREDLHER